MPLGHAVTRIDHHAGQVFQVDAGHVLDQKVKEHIRYTRQHCSQVRSEHEVFAEVCAALAGIESVLVAGSHTTQVDFRHYVEKHHPALAAQIMGWETVNHPTEGETVKLAREFFVKRGELVAAPRMT